MSELTDESEALLAKVSSDWDMDPFGEYESAKRRMEADLVAIEAAAVRRAAQPGRSCVGCDASVGEHVHDWEPGRSASDGVGRLVDRIETLETAFDELMGLRIDHDPDCYVTEEVGCVCGLTQSIERLTDVALDRSYRAALATPPPAPDGGREMASEEYRRGWDAGYGRRASDLPPTPAAAVSGAMEGMARQFGAVCRALGIDPNEADDLGTAVEEALAAAAVSVSALGDWQGYAGRLGEAMMALGHHNAAKHQGPNDYDSESGLACAIPQCIADFVFTLRALAAARDTGARDDFYPEPAEFRPARDTGARGDER